MRWGISSVPLPPFMPFLNEIEQVCSEYPGGFPPCLLGALKVNETGMSADPNIMQIGTVAGTDYLSNGDNAGHGPFQLTYSWPPDWRNPIVSARYALNVFFAPPDNPNDGLLYWASEGFVGDDLIKCAGATYNAGISQAKKGHAEGNVDKYTTNGYGARLVINFRALVNGRTPT